MAKLTIVSFYEKVGEIISDFQEHILTEANATLKMERLIAQAKQDDLKINMTSDVLHAINQNDKPSALSKEADEDVDYDPSMIC